MAIVGLHQKALYPYYFSSFIDFLLLIWWSGIQKSVYKHFREEHFSFHNNIHFNLANLAVWFHERESIKTQESVHSKMTKWHTDDVMECAIDVMDGKVPQCIDDYLQITWGALQFSKNSSLKHCWFGCLWPYFSVFV